MEDLNRWLPLFLPIALIQLGLMVTALVDLVRRERVRGPKWAWALAICLLGFIGPVVYFVAGREE